jgi:hypothetical protein
MSAEGFHNFWLFLASVFKKASRNLINLFFSLKKGLAKNLKTFLLVQKVLI